MSTSFVNYRKDTESLETLMHALFADYGIKHEDQVAIESFMAPLRDKGPEYHDTYEHSIRLALLGAEVAGLLCLDPKVLIFACLLHDIGKVLVPKETLGKTSGWTEKDTQNMKPHVMDAYCMIRDRFDFTAEVILWHHKFQAKGYPANLPRPLHKYRLRNKIKIPYYGLLLSLCDQFDAFHRVNDKHGELRAPTGEEIKALMLKFNAEESPLIEKLYQAGIFTTYTAPFPQMAE